MISSTPSEQRTTCASELTSLSGVGSVASISSSYKARSKKRISRIINGGRFCSVAVFVLFVVVIVSVSTFVTLRGGMDTATNIGEETVQSILDYIMGDISDYFTMVSTAVSTNIRSLHARYPTTFDTFEGILYFANEFALLERADDNIIGFGAAISNPLINPEGSIVLAVGNQEILMANSSTYYMYKYKLDPNGFLVMQWDEMVFTNSMVIVDRPYWREAVAALEAGFSKTSTIVTAPFYSSRDDITHVVCMYPIYDVSYTSLRGFGLGDVRLEVVMDFIHENISDFLNEFRTDFDACLVQKNGEIIRCTCTQENCGDDLRPALMLNESSARVGRVFKAAIHSIGGIDQLFLESDGSAHSLLNNTNGLPSRTFTVDVGEEYIVSIRVIGEEYYTQLVLFALVRKSALFSELYDAAYLAILITSLSTLVACVVWGFITLFASRPLHRLLLEDRKRQLRLVSERERLNSRLAAASALYDADNDAKENENLIEITTETPLSKALQILRSMNAIDPSPELENIIQMLKRANNLQAVEWKRQINDVLKGHSTNKGLSGRTNRGLKIHDEETTKWLEQTFAHGGSDDGDSLGPLIQAPSHARMKGKNVSKGNFGKKGKGGGANGPAGGKDQSMMTPTSLEELTKTDTHLSATFLDFTDEPDSVLADPLKKWIPLSHFDEVQMHLAQWNNLSFSMFQLDELSNNHALPVLTAHLFSLFHLTTELSLSPSKFIHFITRVEQTYRANPYHNATHAAEVLGLSVKLVTDSILKPHFGPLDLLTLMVAAVGHDLDHPGVNNLFLINTTDELALRYNDKSVLENYHCATLFSFLSQPEYDFIEALTPQARKEFRDGVILCILGTDMAHHFTLVGEFTTRMEEKPPEDGLEMKRETKHMFSRVAVKLADIGHTFKATPLTSLWTERVNQEFFAQGDREKALSIPVSQFMDRATMNIPKSQIGFLDFVVRPLVKAWCTAVQSLDALKGLDWNRKFWVRLHEREIPTVPDPAVIEEILQAMRLESRSSVKF